jgi:hypothetical protein
VEALVWLAIPFVVTAIAAIVLQARARRAEDATHDEDARRRSLARIERALTDGRRRTSAGSAPGRGL